jgi:uncharacterized protein (TIGR03067 family)
MLRLLALLVVASAVVAAPVPKGMKAKPTLVGTWEATSMKMKDTDILPANSSVWVIGEGTLVRNTRQPDGTLQPSQPIDFVPDPDRPGELDYTDRNGGGPDGNLWRALYSVTADELVISFGVMNEERPTELKEGVGQFYCKFKRVVK